MNKYEGSIKGNEQTQTAISRRDFVSMAGIGIVAASLGESASLMAATTTPTPKTDHWLSLLGQSEQGNRHYIPKIEGVIPKDINGALFRNGPGLFERNRYRIKNLLDGDGLIQKLTLQDGKAHYQNRFVETPKFVEEEAKGKKLHATWSTRKPGGFINNIGGGVNLSQAGVTVYPINGKLIARDETGPSYFIDSNNLGTLDSLELNENTKSVGIKAHSKIDPQTGDWLLMGQEFGPSMTVHLLSVDKRFKTKKHYRFTTPRQVYLHDYIVTKNHFVLVLHPCELSPLPFLSGMKSFTESLNWKKANGNLVAIYPRAGGKPRFYEAPASFMWHSLNAYEQANEIIVDFVGYDAPDHFLGKEALFNTIMEGRMGLAAENGKIRRYVIQKNSQQLREEIVDADNHEFPMIDSRALMTSTEFGFFASSGIGGCNSGLKRVNYKNGETDSYDFGDLTQVGEPVFIPKNNRIHEGYLIAQTLDGKSRKSYFSLFDAMNIKQGPLAKVWLNHHAPISFHGSWMPQTS